MHTRDCTLHALQRYPTSRLHTLCRKEIGTLHKQQQDSGWVRACARACI
jgi:hypothetical protein